MSIPDYQSIMLPLLKLVSDKQEYKTRDCIDKLADKFNLSEDERKELLASGQQIFDNRVGWARTYLKKAGLLESPKRGLIKITQRGIDAVNSGINEINGAYLSQFTEFLNFVYSPKKEVNTGVVSNETSHKTPEDSLDEAYTKLRTEVAQEILNKLKECSASFFEKVVVDLLLKMGYGGSRKDAGKAIGKSGDGGIDGIIKEDKLGLDILYIQAKRWDNATVGRPEIQKFAGALLGQKARKGIFITTSSFTNDAKKYVSDIESKIVLIDGEELAQHMLDYDIGVSKVTTYEIKKIDSDYFNEE